MRNHANLPHLQALSDVGMLAEQYGPSPASKEITSPAHRSAFPNLRPSFVTQLLDIHEYERQRMGQELHDSAGQLLVALHLSVARLRTAEENCGHAVLIDEIQQTVKQIDQEIRALAFLHYPAELGDRGLRETLQSLVQGFARRTGIRTSFKFLGDGLPIAEAISITVLRVAQEALVNIHRHSRATVAKVILQSAGNLVRLTVADNGIGIPDATETTKGRGIGLQGMRHRVGMLGGRFNVINLKHGTRVSVTIPLGA